MSWGTRRRNTVVFLVIVFLLIPLAVGLFLAFYNPPSCFDGKQNGKESGVDCGGNCELICTSETLPPVVVWQRFFEVENNVYNLLAYVENPNPSAGVKELGYKFTLYNRDNVPIAEKTGFFRLRPKSVVPIIENGINTKNQSPERVTFEILDDYLFEKEQPRPNVLIIKNENYRSGPTPRVTATIDSISLNPIEDISVIVLLYDVFDNVVGSSSTYIEKIDGEGSESIVFTWPNRFREDVTRLEIIPIYEN